MKIQKKLVPMRGTTRNPVRNTTETFPSQTELTVAKALLLLSSKPISFSFLSPSSSSTFRFGDQSFRDEDSSPGDSKSASSTISSQSGSSSVVEVDLFRVLAVAARLQDVELKVKSGSNEDSSPSDSKSCSTISSEASSAGNVEVAATRPHEMKFKVIRKARSKHHRNHNPHRHGRLCFTWRKSAILTSRPLKEEKSQVSLVSDANNAVLALPIQEDPVTRGENIESFELKRQKVASPYLKRRAEAILKFLSAGSASEVRIREAIGNSPDTSKALRMLLKLEKVRRCGAGGQRDPYIYMVAGSGSTVDSS